MMRLGPKPLASVGILERNDLQQMIKNTPAEFFAELGEQLLPLGEEIRPSEVVDDRIDLLALDADGATVVIELKRGAHKLQLLQALTYAALVAQRSNVRF
jgi:RecB family endonuclease NucS